MMAKKLFPDYANCISMALTPMTLTARLIKKQHEKAKVVFIGPCAAKKLEAMRKSVRSEVDFVLTFEEMAGIFDAKHVDIENIAEDAALTPPSSSAISRISRRMRAESMRHPGMEETSQLPAASRNPWWM